MNLNFKKLDERAILPTCDHEGDSGLGLYLLEDVVLRPFVPTLIPHGIGVQCPKGYELQIRPRSSTLIRRGVIVQLGTIDSSYTGNLMTCAIYIPQGYDDTDCDGYKTGDLAFDRGGLEIKAGDRISQLVLAPVVYASDLNVQAVDDLTETSRGAGGIGSTGS